MAKGEKEERGGDTDNADRREEKEMRYTEKGPEGREKEGVTHKVDRNRVGERGARGNRRREGELRTIETLGKSVRERERERGGGETVERVEISWGRRSHR